MIQLDFTYAPTNPPDKSFDEVLAGFQARKQGFLDVLDEPIEPYLSFAEKFKDKFDEVLVLGIGGSALGGKMLADFFGGKKLRVLDTLDPEEVAKFPHSPNTLVVVISKSGGTLETMALRDHFLKKLPLDRFVVVTETGSTLWDWAEKKQVPAFEMPQNVGGRFSVLTSVGLLPAAVADLPIRQILDGARKMRAEFESPDGLPWQLAQAIWGSGKAQLVHFPYGEKLKTFGDWWVQLVGESTGKEGKGFTPISAVGPTDQHSLLQLLSDGPDTFLSLFVENKAIETDPLGKIVNAECRATAQSLGEKGRPNITIRLSKLDAETLGQLIVLWEGTVALLGELLEINAFDQPGVERGKILTQQFLKQS